MLEVIVGHVLSFVELLGGLQYRHLLFLSNGVILPSFPARLCILTLLNS
jgi:hypothetical protein